MALPPNGVLFFEVDVMSVPHKCNSDVYYQIQMNPLSVSYKSYLFLLKYEKLRFDVMHNGL